MSVIWNRDEDKAFENAIAVHLIHEIDDNEDSQQQQWEKIAATVPGKTIQDVKLHYRMLVEDLQSIESGNTPVPNYGGGEEATTTTTNTTSLSNNKESGNNSNNNNNTSTSRGGSDKRGGGGVSCGNNGGVGFSGLGLGAHHDSSGHGSKGGSRSEQERKKGIPWTEEEHRLFLLGLDKFGKGDWRSISRNFVISRTPTQVASHAQKYFIRLNSMNRDRRRSSIHDITSVNNGSDVPTHQAPITGQQTNAYAASAAAIGPPSVKHHRPHHQPPHMAGLGMYGAPMGHPVSAPPGHMASAVGTPVMLPPGHHHHAHPPPYVVPVAYPMAHPTMHQ